MFHLFQSDPVTRNYRSIFLCSLDSMEEFVSWLQQRNVLYSGSEIIYPADGGHSGVQLFFVDEEATEYLGFISRQACEILYEATEGPARSDWAALEHIEEMCDDALRSALISEADFEDEESSEILMLEQLDPETVLLTGKQKPMPQVEKYDYRGAAYYEQKKAPFWASAYKDRTLIFGNIVECGTFEWDVANTKFVTLNGMGELWEKCLSQGWTPQSFSGEEYTFNQIKDGRSITHLITPEDFQSELLLNAFFLTLNKLQPVFEPSFVEMAENYHMKVFLKCDLCYSKGISITQNVYGERVIRLDELLRLIGSREFVFQSSNTLGDDVKLTFTCQKTFAPRIVHMKNGPIFNRVTQQIAFSTPSATDEMKANFSLKSAVMNLNLFNIKIPSDLCTIAAPVFDYVGHSGSVAVPKAKAKTAAQIEAEKIAKDNLRQALMSGPVVSQEDQNMALTNSALSKLSAMSNEAEESNRIIQSLKFILPLRSETSILENDISYVKSYPRWSLLFDTRTNELLDIFCTTTATSWNKLRADVNYTHSAEDLVYQSRYGANDTTYFQNKKCGNPVTNGGIEVHVANHIAAISFTFAENIPIKWLRQLEGTQMIPKWYNFDLLKLNIEDATPNLTYDVANGKYTGYDTSAKPIKAYVAPKTAVKAKTLASFKVDIPSSNPKFDDTVPFYISAFSKFCSALAK